MQIKVHMGIYGVCIEHNKLLCIKKTAGPYKNRYDLPGGSQKSNEGLTETLKREILEETGYTLESYENPRVYDAFITEKDKEYTVHHIMIIYDIHRDINIPKKEVPEFMNNELNDSESEVWISIDELTLENSSPLVLKLKKEMLSNVSLDKDIYSNWKVI